jgi:hypothetical protein
MAAKSQRPQRDRLKSLPSALSHRKSREGIVTIWRTIAKAVYSPRTLGDMPVFAERLAKTFWDIDAAEVIAAIRNGDPALFVAFQIRLDQLDCAMVALGRSLADRAPLVRSKYLLDGFLQAAVDSLVARGGTWPPDASSSPPS